MIVAPKQKFVFIHVQRTGGTSLTNALKESLGRAHKDYPQHWNAQTAAANILEKYKGYYCFGFTRNPWERIFSWYALIYANDSKSLAEERLRFEAFLQLDEATDFTQNLFHYNTLDYFTNKEGALIADKIYEYKNINDDIKSLFDRFNLPLSEIPNMNTGAKKNHKDFYTQKSYNLIAQKCKKDIQYFNYSF
jgi:hypothetical protein